MELSDLVSYAKETYGVSEQHKWASFPGYSVLVDPSTLKWAALLMRQWSSDLGEEIQRADIKCGPLDESLKALPYLSAPFRMKGTSWVGVTFNATTDAQVVLRLLDKALSKGSLVDRFTISLEAQQPQNSNAYKDTPISRRHVNAHQKNPRRSGYHKGHQNSFRGSTQNECHSSFRGGTQNERQNSFLNGHNSAHQNSFLGSHKSNHNSAHQNSDYSILKEVSNDTFQDDESIPKPIREMLTLYEYGDGSFEQECKNFFVQGTFMESYEDNVPWNRNFKRYFPTYHKLNIPQLRGYFTWRTHYRAGDILPAPASFAYLYVYELLNGIGTSSKEDALLKLDEFVEKFIESGIGDQDMRRYLDRWRYEFAIINNFPLEVAKRYANPYLLRCDGTLETLKNAHSYSDAEVYAALQIFAKKGTATSPVLRKYPDVGESLFAESWRAALRDGLLDSCFGAPVKTTWRPLSNAVVWQSAPHADAVYEISATRIYRCENNTWTEQRYESLFFSPRKFQEFMHGVDSFLRKKLKTGHYLKERESEAWIEPHVDEAINAVKKAQEEAARPKIEIDTSQLERIRGDAAITRENLLTEEDVNSGLPETITIINKVVEEATAADTIQPKTNNDPSTESLLASMELQVLTLLLDGEKIDSFIRANHLMASVVADSINEMLFDELGDNVVESDGSSIALIEDYRQDVEKIVRGA